MFSDPPIIALTSTPQPPLLDGERLVLVHQQSVRNAWAITDSEAIAQRSTFKRELLDLLMPLSQWRARKHVWAPWVIRFDPSGCHMRNKLHGDIFRLRTRFVTHVVDVPAAQIREALACSIGFKCAVIVVHCQRSLCDCDQAGTRMRVPAGLTIGLEGDLRDIEVGVASDPREEKPSRQIASTHQIEQAGWEIARRHRG